MRSMRPTRVIFAVSPRIAVHTFTCYLILVGLIDLIPYRIMFRVVSFPLVDLDLVYFATYVFQ